MEHLKLESITDSPDFWNDPFAISSYCNSILQATKKEQEQVSIIISEYNTIPRVSYEKRNSVNKYHIYLPKLKDFYMDLEIQDEDIKLRKAFLKHELAHIVFSEMESYLEHHQETEDKIRFLSNAIEDVRIENFFGKRFPGANDTFFEVQNKFFKKGKMLIETESPNFKNLSLYFLYRSKKFEFENTLPIQIYNSIFEKHSDFLYLSQKELFKLLEKIKNDFQFELDSQKEQIEEYKSQFPEKQKIKVNPEDLQPNFDANDSEMNNQSDVEVEVENNSNNSNGSNFNLNDEESNSSNNPEKNNQDSEEEPESKSSTQENKESEDDLEEENDLEDSSQEDDSELDDEEEDFEEDNEIEEDLEEEEEEEKLEGNSSGDSNSESSSDSNESLKSSDFADMIREQLQKNLDKENKKIDDFNSENQEKDISLDDLKQEKDPETNEAVLDILKIIDYFPDDYFNKISNNSQALDDFLKYNNSKMKSKGSKIVDISRYISVLTQNKKIIKRKRGVPVDTRTIYSRIASKNNKNIVSLINFFKLKFQDKEKSKRFFNKEYGDLHNESLYKLFNDQEDKRIFSNIQKNLVTKQDVSFLLDFSGSMEGYKIKYLLESLVILNEVFLKIEIPYNVFSFTGRSPHYSFPYGSLSEKMLLLKAFSKYFSHSEYQNTIDLKPLNNNLNNITFCLLNRNSKPEERKKIINFLLSMVYGSSNRNILWSNIFGGGTPEIQSVISLYNNLPKQKLFLINDGEYDKIDFFGKEINRISSVESLNIKKLDFYKLGLNFLSGKNFEIKNFQEKTLFIRMLRSISHKFTYRILSNDQISKFFTDGSNFQPDQINLIDEILNDISRFFIDIIYSRDLFENKDFSIDSKYFKLEKNYHSRTDSSNIKVINKNNLPTFSLKVYNKIITYIGKPNWNSSEEKHKILLNLDKVTDILDVYKIICIHDIFKLTETVEKNDISQYTYRDLINKMRSNGWSIFGIGIDSDYGKNYIGDSNFTHVRGYQDIRENLERKIKKIVI